MIERHEIPLFEYDATSPEVIAPAHEFGDCRFPKKCLFAFLGDTIHRYAEAKHAEKRCEFRTVSATYPIYVFEENGEEICLAQAPVGAPPASSMLDALIASGCRSILALRSVMRENWPMVHRGPTGLARTMSSASRLPQCQGQDHQRSHERPSARRASSISDRGRRSAAESSSTSPSSRST